MELIETLWSLLSPFNNAWLNNPSTNAFVLAHLLLLTTFTRGWPLNQIGTRPVVTGRRIIRYLIALTAVWFTPVVYVLEGTFQYYWEFNLHTGTSASNIFLVCSAVLIMNILRRTDNDKLGKTEALLSALAFALTTLSALVLTFTHNDGSLNINPGLVLDFGVRAFGATIIAQTTLSAWIELVTPQIKAWKEIATERMDILEQNTQPETDVVENEPHLPKSMLWEFLFRRQKYLPVIEGHFSLRTRHNNTIKWGVLSVVYLMAMWSTHVGHSHVSMENTWLAGLSYFAVAAVLIFVTITHVRNWGISRFPRHQRMSGVILALILLGTLTNNALFNSEDWVISKTALAVNKTAGWIGGVNDPKVYITTFPDAAEQIALEVAEKKRSVVVTREVFEQLDERHQRAETRIRTLDSQLAAAKAEKGVDLSTVTYTQLQDGLSEETQQTIFDQSLTRAIEEGMVVRTHQIDAILDMQECNNVVKPNYTDDDGNKCVFVSCPTTSDRFVEVAVMFESNDGLGASMSACEPPK